MRRSLYDDVRIELPRWLTQPGAGRAPTNDERLSPTTLLMTLTLIVLLAFAVRAYRLDAQSIWYDEGNSIALAQRDIATIIRSAASDIHPPLYYIVLHIWVQLLGVSVAAVRLLSVILGTLTVIVTYLIGRRLMGERTGLLAAFLAALSPFLVYYSQEARMYMLATLLGALSVYFLLLVDTPLMHLTAPNPARRWLRQDGAPPPATGPATWPQRWLWLAYIAVTAAALYSHYFAAAVALAQGLAIIVAFVLELLTAKNPRAHAQEEARRLWPFVAAQICIAFLYLPWLPVMAGQFSNWPAISEFYNLPVLVARLFPIFSLGLSIQTGAVLLPLLVFGAFVLLGMLAPPLADAPMAQKPGRLRALAAKLVRGQGSDGYIIAVLWLATPILVMFLLSLRRPLYNPKFLLVAAPAFCLLLANGLRRLSLLRSALHRQEIRWDIIGTLLALIGLVIVVVSSWRSLQSYYFDARYARDNYRAVAQTIASGARPGDAILLDAPGQTDVFGYYDKGSLPTYLLPRQRPLDEQSTLQELAAIAAGHERIWVVYYGDQQADPRRVIASWLEAKTYKASDRWFGNVRLVLYALPTAQSGQVQPLNVRFGPSIELLGYRLDAPLVAAGDIAPLTLFWQSATTPAERYTVFAHVINAHAVLWGQRDSEPGGGLRPTTTWQPGETIQDNYGLPTLPGTPPGEYQIEIGLYRPASGERLLADRAGKPLGDHILLGPLTITRPATPPAEAALAMEHPSTARFGALRLLGYNLGKLGQDGGATEFAAGDVLHLTLFWQTPAQALADLTIVVQALDSRGKVVLQRESAPVDGDYPTSGWAAAEIVRDQHRLALGGLAAGTYRLVIEVREESGKRVGQTVLGELKVR